MQLKQRICLVVFRHQSTSLFRVGWLILWRHKCLGTLINLKFNFSKKMPTVFKKKVSNIDVLWRNCNLFHLLGTPVNPFFSPHSLDLIVPYFSFTRGLVGKNSEEFSRKPGSFLFSDGEKWECGCCLVFFFFFSHPCEIHSVCSSP